MSARAYLTVSSLPTYETLLRYELSYINKYPLNSLQYTATNYLTNYLHGTSDISDRNIRWPQKCDAIPIYSIRQETGKVHFGAGAPIWSPLLSVVGLLHLHSPQGRGRVVAHRPGLRVIPGNNDTLPCIDPVRPTVSSEGTYE